MVDSIGEKIEMSFWPATIERVLKGLEAMTFSQFVMMIYYFEEVMTRAKSAREEGTSGVATIMFKDSCLSGRWRNQEKPR